MVNRQQSARPVELTPTEIAQRESQNRIERLLPAAELKHMNNDPIIPRMWNQRPNLLFETPGQLPGINALFDPDYTAAMSKNQSIDLDGTPLSDALDSVAKVTRSYWKPVSENSIFVTQDNPVKRKKYETEEVRVFYLSNVTSAQELQEVMTTLRQVIEVNKLFNVAS